MKELEYKILTYLYNKKEPEPTKINIEEYWNIFYEAKETMKQKNFLITHEEFETIITEIYNTLKLRLQENTVELIISHYLYLIAADIIIDKQDITARHCIENLYQLITYPEKKHTKKYSEDILYIQNKLYQKLSIHETNHEKIKRRFRTRILTKI